VVWSTLSSTRRKKVDNKQTALYSVTSGGIEWVERALPFRLWHSGIMLVARSHCAAVGGGGVGDS